ncbi:MAG TPA: hypothetical protein VF881_06960 [Polyangiaceae bacterium]
MTAAVLSVMAVERRTDHEFMPARRKCYQSRVRAARYERQGPLDGVLVVGELPGRGGSGCRSDRVERMINSLQSSVCLGLVALAACRAEPSTPKSAPAIDTPAPTTPGSPSVGGEPDRPLTNPSRADCVKDTDCVPAVCCHANRCVPKAEKPACQGIMCTMMCAPHTIDCGGGCSCQSGQCVARLIDKPQ